MTRGRIPIITDYAKTDLVHLKVAPYGGSPSSQATPVSNFLKRARPVVTVAASDTSDADTRSDYQCDGTADDVEIQAALDALPATGGHVLLLEGSYSVAAKIIVPGGTLLSGIGTTYDGAYHPTLITSEVAGDTCIQIGDGTAPVGQGASICGIRIEAGVPTNGIGIYIYGPNFCVIRNVAVTGYITGTGIKIAGGTAAVACIQCRVSDVYLSNNLTNLHLAGLDAENTSSADEGYYDNVRISLASLANSVGVYIEKGFGNQFNRLTVNGVAKTAGTLAIHCADGARSMSWAARENLFNSLVIERVTTVFKFEANTYGNIFFGVHIHDNDTIADDDSGGGNIIHYATGGINLSNPTMYQRDQSHHNHLRNSIFQNWEAGVAVAPTDWTLAGGGASIAQDAVNYKAGSYSAEVTRAGADVAFSQSIDDIAPFLGRWASLGGWVKCSEANVAQLRIATNIAGLSSVFHPGDGEWHYLSTRKPIEAAAASITVVLRVINTNAAVNFDMGSILQGLENLPTYDTPLLTSNRLVRAANWNPANINDGATSSTTVTVTGAVVGDPVTVGFASITAAGWQISGQVTAANTVTATLTNHTGGAVDLPDGALSVVVWKL